MPQPTYLHLYRSGFRTMVDAVILWHLAECGVTASTTAQISQSLRIPVETTRASLHRLRDKRLIASPEVSETQGCPHRWTISRIGYRFITGSSVPQEKTMAPILNAT